MGTARARLATLGLMLVVSIPGSALAAKWTVATILVGEYEDMEKRLKTTGSSDDVNVVVLHYKGSNNVVAYRLLKDTNTAHPPGQCCPNGETTCCDIEAIPLTSIGIGNTLTAEAVKKFYQHVVQKYPADHYLMGLRGEPFGNTGVLAGAFTSGITIAKLNEALKTVVDMRGGKKVEVLVIGFCTSGALDWAYGVSPYVDYYVGTPQFTNPPVAVRWRVYRWGREVIENPGISGRELASKVVDLFALTTTDCIENSNGCSNAPDEPWTCVAVDEAKLPAVAEAVKDAVCAVLPTVTSQMHSSVLAGTTLYCSSQTPRYDMASYFMNLKEKVTDTAAKAAIDRVLAAHKASIVNWKYEPGFYNDRAYGYSFYTMKNLGSVTDIGTWQIDSLWQAYMAKVGGTASPLPAPTGLVIDPPKLEEGVGEQASLTARGVSAKFPSMCALSPVTWDTSSLNGVATPSGTSANPVVITGQKGGTGLLKVSASSLVGQAEVTISPPDAGEPTTPDAGLNPGQGGGSNQGQGGQGASNQGTGGGPSDAVHRRVAGGCDATGAGFGMLVPALLWMRRLHRGRSNRPSA
jgi:hypothetical protein